MTTSDPSATREAVSFVRKHGAVLASARGPAPRLIDEIAGEVIQGNWWAHPRAHFIYNTLADVQADEDILVCRLLQRRITLVHRLLWPALVRLAPSFEPEGLARVADVHTASGRHVSTSIAFPDWVSSEVLAQAAQLTEQQAVARLPCYLLPPRRTPPRKSSITSRRTKNAA